MLNEASVKVPATSANMGAGFDTFGMAFAMYNTVTIKKIEGDEIKLNNIGEATNGMQVPEKNLVVSCAKQVFEKANVEFKGLEFILDNQIPVSRGLGSSSAAIVGGLVAANALLEDALSERDLVNMAVEIEGHPDNVAPAFYGGFVSSCMRNGKTSMLKIQPPKKLRAVVAIPDFHLPTKVARQALPKEVSMADAVYNIQCASMMVGAMATGNLQLLGKALDDKLHQPYRFPLIKGSNKVLSAAKKAGALGSAISGAGPTLIAFTATDGVKIQEAMDKAWREMGVNPRVLILEQDNLGVQKI